MTSPLPADLTAGIEIASATLLSGGDVARAFRLDTTSGPLFLKWHPDPSPGLFEREAAGLRALRAAGAARVPEVVRESPAGLVLEWIEPGPRSAGTEREFGAELAALHRTTHDTFGAVDGAPAGFLGSQPVDLTPTSTWVELFFHRRVMPLTETAIASGRLDAAARDLVDRLAPRAAELCGPAEPPALVHGDLWAGNRLIDAHGRSWLIDPAAHWGHRELDLAMMQLFGGFGDCVFAAYDEAFPLSDGWRDRVPWYQLPPLLVHAVKFGGSYGAAALAALRRYA
ncbi:fructosamine kinase family protein [Desertimonas flava]|uniref:fructosamine kinase family protein n=1 Tax=Desertimonas flava TaxID=2064846 RepID=UPI000E3416E1|nr:fructosamine kinase family protein [Desertimonas flava]